MRIEAVGSAYFGQKSAGTSQSKTLGAGQFNNPSFSAVNQKYIKWAENDYKLEGCIGSTWMHNIMEEHFFKTIPEQDVIDTLKAARKYVSPASMKVYDRFVTEVLGRFC